MCMFGYFFFFNAQMCGNAQKSYCVVFVGFQTNSVVLSILNSFHAFPITL